MKINKVLFSFLKFQKVYALVGRSGTGKSFRARLIAQKYNIDYIIDDGLFIYRNTLLGGRSAKKEDLYIKAIKTAIFENEAHRKEVAALIKERRVKKILIIGTSEKMVRLICRRLSLAQPCKIIRIEEVSSREEIKRALESRQREGKHVVPVPSLEIKKQYPDLWVDSLRLFIRKQLRNPKKNRSGMIEKSIIRPDFTQKGAISLSESALAQMIYHCADEFNSDYSIKKLTLTQNGNKYDLDLSLKVPLGENLAVRLHEFQDYIITGIEKYTGMMIGEVNLDVSEIKNNPKHNRK